MEQKGKLIEIYADSTFVKMRLFDSVEANVKYNNMVEHLRNPSTLSFDIVTQGNMQVFVNGLMVERCFMLKKSITAITIRSYAP